MSNREIAVDIINQIPEYKLTYVIEVLNGIKKLIVDDTENAVTVEPDEWDLAMIAEAEKINDGTTVSLEELLERDGFTYADLQD